MKGGPKSSLRRFCNELFNCSGHQQMTLYHSPLKMENYLLQVHYFIKTKNAEDSRNILCHQLQQSCAIKKRVQLELTI